MQVITVPIFSDNYSYIIVDRASRQCAAVDPADPSSLLTRISEEGLELKYILTTHSHSDHAGGNVRMKESVPGVVVVGGKGDRAAGVTMECGEGDSISFGCVNITVISTPCHTQGHVCYLAGASDSSSSSSPLSLFTGDTLFVAGCGNFNSGTAAQMLAAFDKINSLPPETQLYVGHEYTVRNLKFALSVEPSNAEVQKKLLWSEETVGDLLSSI
jgi:hydroxyacylglutathione hydrolase